MIWASARIVEPNSTIVGQAKSSTWIGKVLDINPKKGKKAFYETKTVFVKKNGWPYCEKCKKMGHNEKNCTNNKAISFDSSYILMKDSKSCVSAKYVGLPIYGTKMNAIWVPKILVTNIQGPKKIWVPKRVTSLLYLNYKAGGRHWVLDSGLLALLNYPFYPLFILNNGMNLISKSLTVLTPA